MRRFALAVVIAATATAALVGDGLGSIQPVPNASGCQRVPSSGTLSPGFAAATTLEYSNYWQWSTASAGQSFDWSIRKNDGTVVASGSSSGGGGNRTVAANDYIFRIVNRGSVGQFWNVCYDVV
jgi:hypothetical protein